MKQKVIKAVETDSIFTSDYGNQAADGMESLIEVCTHLLETDSKYSKAGVNLVGYGSLALIVICTGVLLGSISLAGQVVFFKHGSLAATSGIILSLVLLSLVSHFRLQLDPLRNIKQLKKVLLGNVTSLSLELQNQMRGKTCSPHSPGAGSTRNFCGLRLLASACLGCTRVCYCHILALWLPFNSPGRSRSNFMRFWVPTCFPKPIKIHPKSMPAPSHLGIQFLIDF